jgi:hypothetical protein
MSNKATFLIRYEPSLEPYLRRMLPTWVRVASLKETDLFFGVEGVRVETVFSNVLKLTKMITKAIELAKREHSKRLTSPSVEVQEVKSGEDNNERGHHYE